MNYRISLPNGQVIACPILYRHVPIVIADYEFPGDLIRFDISEFDIILGMDWLTAYGATIDCKNLMVTLRSRGNQEVCFHGEKFRKDPSVISIMKVRKSLRQGCIGYLCYAVEVKEEEMKIEDIPVVREFSNVFPEELSGLPPQREIYFEIELVPGVQPISKTPYRMAPTELKELKAQLNELFQKGFIRPSVSPWGAPVVFVKKKDGALRLFIDY